MYENALYDAYRKTNGIILDNTKNVEADSHPASKKVENACEPASPFTVGFVHAKR
jgi:hypothetical protein